MQMEDLLTEYERRASKAERALYLEPPESTVALTHATLAHAAATAAVALARQGADAWRERVVELLRESRADAQRAVARIAALERQEGKPPGWQARTLLAEEHRAGDVALCGPDCPAHGGGE